MTEKKILIVGETWISYFSNIKGRNEYHGATLQENPGLLKLLEVFENYDVKVTHLANHDSTNYFPFELEELQEFNCIILSDVGSDSFLLHPNTTNLENPRKMPDRLKLIDAFVNKGGGLLMIGGWMSFSGIEGKARYHMTVLADTLPIRMLPFDDRVECCDGVRPVVQKNHPILNGIDEKWPEFLGYQKLEAKEDAVVLMNANDDPFLCISDYGKGRVAAFSSDCGPHWRMLEFLNWEYYGKFWYELVSWLSNDFLPHGDRE